MYSALAPFQPAVRQWFTRALGEPSAPQQQGWPKIRAGLNTLIAAPTGTGKTLTAFLSAIDLLLSEGDTLPGETQVLYISPLKALASDIQKNLEKPLREIRAIDPTLPEIRAVVRTGDTEAKARAAMLKKPPHILVTTPESLYILLTSDGGRRILRTVKTIIVDEIHALARDKRGSHLALSLERLEALCAEYQGCDSRPLQRIGLSATQKPLDEVGRFLVGEGRECALVDIGHLRQMDLAIEVPPSPLTAVCSHEVWDEIYERVATLVREHRTTLVFVNTRRMAERIAARLATRLEPDKVACHHGSLSATRRHDAEQRLKAGQLQVLVATASLNWVSTLAMWIWQFRLAHRVPLPRCCSAWAARATAKIASPRAASSRSRWMKWWKPWRSSAASRRRFWIAPRNQGSRSISWRSKWWPLVCPRCGTRSNSSLRCGALGPIAILTTQEFDEVIALHSVGRWSLLHRDGVHNKLRATKRARLTAITSGGAIGDTADYQVILEPEGTFIGTLNEDFAIESSAGDIFQLGATSWRILGVNSGTVRVADAQGAPPTIPLLVG